MYQMEYELQQKKKRKEICHFSAGKAMIPFFAMPGHILGVKILVYIHVCYFSPTFLASLRPGLPTEVR